MNRKGLRISLMGKMLLWLMLHMALLAVIVTVFVTWQFRAGLDGYLQGPAGDRLRVYGEQMAAKLRTEPVRDWQKTVQEFSDAYQAKSYIWMPHGDWSERPEEAIPEEIIEHLRRNSPQGPAGRRVGPPGGPRPGAGPGPRRGPPPEDEEMREEDFPPEIFEEEMPPVRQTNDYRPVTPLFLRSPAGSPHYWAAVHLPLAGRTAPDRVIWVIRANNLTGNGLFFDLKPLIIAVSVLLGLSILFWMPFAISITRYIGKLKSATDEIADGKFQVNLDTRRRDELGSLGSAIVSMSSRLDHLVSGQKRFLGDIAHELCSPLARMRTGLSILETKLPASEQARLAAIEEEATELAELIDEILAFSRSTAGISQIKGKPLCLHDLITDLLSRENHQLNVENNIAPELHVLADQKLLQRAIGNLIRNTIRYAGPNAILVLRASLRDASIELQIIDNGPGVPEAEIPHLFEPFYRPDIARTRETGGVGLGLTIVKSCIVACGGSIVASNAKPQGFAIEITLPSA